MERRIQTADPGWTNLLILALVLIELCLCGVLTGVIIYILVALN